MRRVGKGAQAESKDRQTSQSVKRFGKVWQEGDIFRLFIPNIYDDNNLPDLMVGSCWGHELDGEALGIKKYYAPTSSEIYRGKPVKPDLLFKLSWIARALYNAEQMAEQMAISQDKSLGDQERIQELNKCKAKWDEKSPAVGKLKKTIMTEAVVIPFKEVVLAGTGGKKDTTVLRPDTERMAHVRIDLSEDRIRAIRMHMQADDCAIHEDYGVIEIQQTFPKVGDRAKAGREAQPELVTLEESLFTKFPDQFKLLTSLISRLPEDGEILHNRTQDFDPIPQGELVSTFSSFLKKKSSFIPMAAEDDKNLLLQNALVFKELRVVVKDEALQAEFAEKVREFTELELLAKANKDAEDAERVAEEKAEKAGQEADSGTEKKEGTPSDSGTEKKEETPPTEESKEDTSSTTEGNKEVETSAQTPASGKKTPKAKGEEKPPSMEDLHKKDIEDAEEKAEHGEEIDPDDFEDVK